MKRLFSVLCAFCLMGMFGLTSCSSQGVKPIEDINVTESKYIGTWICKDANIGDNNAPFEDEIKLVLNADATGELSSAGEVSKFVWQENDQGFIIESDEVNMTFKEDENKIVAKVIGVSLIFERENK